MAKTTPPKTTTKKSPKKAETKAKKQAKESSPIGPNTTVVLTIPEALTKKTYDKVLKKLAKEIKADGFRKGNVPTHIAEEKIGQIKIVESVLDEVIPDIYVETIKKEKKQPISRPEFKPLKLEMGKDWEVEATFAELPKISLGKYQDTVKKARKEADKQVIKVEKEQKEKHDKEGHADDHNHDLTDEQKKEMVLQNIFRNLAQSLKPSIPEILLKQETQHEFEEMKRNLAQMNLSVDDYLQKRGMKFEDLSNELAMSVLGRLQLDFILGAIAKEQKFESTDKDVEAFIEKIQDERTKQLVSTDPNYKQQVQLTVIRQKVVDYLYNIK